MDAMDDDEAYDFDERRRVLLESDATDALIAGETGTGDGGVREGNRGGGEREGRARGAAEVRGGGRGDGVRIGDG